MNMNVSNSDNIVKTQKTTYDTQNITLDGVECLRAKRTTVVHEISMDKTSRKVIADRIIKRHTESVCYPLTEVMPEDLKEFREKGISSFVLKADGHFYHAVIPDDISFYTATSLGVHMCSSSDKRLCRRLSAASDENHGCQKVRDTHDQIEKYPWITNGYETFNTQHDSFVVLNCLHYEMCPPRKAPSPSEIAKARLSLAQFYYDDEITSLAEVRRRKEKNLK